MASTADAPCECVMAACRRRHVAEGRRWYVAAFT